MRRDTFEILAVLAGGARSAPEIRDALGRAGDLAPLATFYRRLNEAIEVGWVDDADVLSPQGQGRPAKHFRLTPEGRTAARAYADRSAAFASLLEEGERGSA